MPEPPAPAAAEPDPAGWDCEVCRATNRAEDAACTLCTMARPVRPACNGAGNEDDARASVGRAQDGLERQATVQPAGLTFSPMPLVMPELETTVHPAAGEGGVEECDRPSAERPSLTPPSSPRAGGRLSAVRPLDNLH